MVRMGNWVWSSGRVREAMGKRFSPRDEYQRFSGSILGGLWESGGFMRRGELPRYGYFDRECGCRSR